MSARAARSPAKAFGSAAMTRGIASRQIASTKALARALTNGSISCVKASRPVDAVSAGGRS